MADSTRSDSQMCYANSVGHHADLVIEHRGQAHNQALSESVHSADESDEADFYYQLRKLIQEYEPNPEEQMLLELSKQKTVEEIDVKFHNSKVNATFVFPRLRADKNKHHPVMVESSRAKILPNSSQQQQQPQQQRNNGKGNLRADVQIAASRSSSEDSLKSLDGCLTYNLFAQNKRVLAGVGRVLRTENTCTEEEMCDEDNQSYKITDFDSTSLSPSKASPQAKSPYLLPTKKGVDHFVVKNNQAERSSSSNNHASGHGRLLGNEPSKETAANYCSIKKQFTVNDHDDRKFKKLQAQQKQVSNQQGVVVLSGKQQQFILHEENNSQSPPKSVVGQESQRIQAGQKLTNNRNIYAAAGVGVGAKSAMMNNLVDSPTQQQQNARALLQTVDSCGVAGQDLQTLYVRSKKPLEQQSQNKINNGVGMATISVGQQSHSTKQQQQQQQRVADLGINENNRKSVNSNNKSASNIKKRIVAVVRTGGILTEGDEKYRDDDRFYEEENVSIGSASVNSFSSKKANGLLKQIQQSVDAQQVRGSGNGIASRNQPSMAKVILDEISDRSHPKYYYNIPMSSQQQQQLLEKQNSSKIDKTRKVKVTTATSATNRNSTGISFHSSNQLVGATSNVTAAAAAAAATAVPQRGNSSDAYEKTSMPKRASAGQWKGQGNSTNVITTYESTEHSQQQQQRMQNFSNGSRQGQIIKSEMKGQLRTGQSPQQIPLTYSYQKVKTGNSNGRSGGSSHETGLAVKKTPLRSNLVGNSSQSITITHASAAESKQRQQESAFTFDGTKKGSGKIEGVENTTTVEPIANSQTGMSPGKTISANGTHQNQMETNKRSAGGDAQSQFRKVRPKLNIDPDFMEFSEMAPTSSSNNNNNNNSNNNMNNNLSNGNAWYPDSSSHLNQQGRQSQFNVKQLSNSTKHSQQQQDLLAKCSVSRRTVTEKSGDSRIGISMNAVATGLSPNGKQGTTKIKYRLKITNTKGMMPTGSGSRVVTSSDQWTSLIPPSSVKDDFQNSISPSGQNRTVFDYSGQLGQYSYQNRREMSDVGSIRNTEEDVAAPSISMNHDAGKIAKNSSSSIRSMRKNKSIHGEISCSSVVPFEKRPFSGTKGIRTQSNEDKKQQFQTQQHAQQQQHWHHPFSTKSNSEVSRINFLSSSSNHSDFVNALKQESSAISNRRQVEEMEFVRKDSAAKRTNSNSKGSGTAVAQSGMTNHKVGTRNQSGHQLSSGNGNGSSGSGGPGGMLMMEESSKNLGPRTMKSYSSKTIKKVGQAISTAEVVLAIEDNNRQGEVSTMQDEQKINLITKQSEQLNRLLDHHVVKQQQQSQQQQQQQYFQLQSQSSMPESTKAGKACVRIFKPNQFSVPQPPSFEQFSQQDSHLHVDTLKNQQIKEPIQRTSLGRLKRISGASMSGATSAGGVAAVAATGSGDRF